MQNRKDVVMIVDDSRTIRQVAANTLIAAGYDVVEAVDGFDALSILRTSKPDVILVDIMMPALDGYQTCALISGSDEVAGIPIITLSSKDGFFDHVRARQVGAQTYIQKPFTQDSLLNMVKKMISASRGSDLEA